MAEESTANGTAVSNVDDADARGTLQGAMAGLSLGTSSKVQTTHSPQLVATAPVQSVASASSQQQAFLSRLAERKQSEKYRRFATEVQRIDLVKAYETSRFGYCVLINEKEFDERATGQRRRDGTDVDADYAEAVFGALGFQVVRFNDLNVTGFRRVISRFASQTNHSSFDMFVMIVLSHGVEGRVFASDGDLSVDADLVDPFRGANCASLIGKPKMFFIQACRGSKFDRGVDVKDGGRTRIPNEADLLIFSSTTPGYFSWRNNQDGSWFMQSLCYVLQTYVLEKDEANGALPRSLDELMNLTKQIVAEKYESCTDAEWSSHMKQMPVAFSTLRKALYLNPSFK